MSHDQRFLILADGLFGPDSSKTANACIRYTPERGGGFNRHAERISRFAEVESCYLMSGGYDLLVFVKGPSLQKVASFVSEQLSTIEGVLSTSTLFMLRCYKEQGFLLADNESNTSRLNVAP